MSEPLYPFPEVLDSSILATWKQCPQLFYKLYIANWKAKEKNVHLHAGGAFAKGLEVARNKFFVEHFSADDSMAYGLQALLETYGDYPCPPDSAKSPERMSGALEFYFSNYPLNEDEYPPITLPSGKRGIEFNFVEPLPILHPVTGNPLLYCGRMDALLGFAGGNFIEDDKTTTSLGATWSRQWELRSQFTGYAWGCQRNGIPIQGVIVRGVSILKTKYETIQAISYRPSWQIDRWFSQTCEMIENEIIPAWKRTAFRYDLDGSCADFGGCAFRQACSTEDETPWLEMNFERRRWDPITRIETKL